MTTIANKLKRILDTKAAFKVAIEDKERDLTDKTFEEWPDEVTAIEEGGGLSFLVPTQLTYPANQIKAVSDLRANVEGAKFRLTGETHPAVTTFSVTPDAVGDNPVTMYYRIRQLGVNFETSQFSLAELSEEQTYEVGDSTTELILAVDYTPMSEMDFFGIVVGTASGVYDTTYVNGELPIIPAVMLPVDLLTLVPAPSSSFDEIGGFDQPATPIPIYDNALFRIANNSLVPAVWLSYDNPVDADTDNVYEVEIEAYTDEESVTQLIEVSVADPSWVPEISFTFTEGNAPLTLSDNLQFKGETTFADLVEDITGDTITLSGFGLFDVEVIELNEIELLSVSELNNLIGLRGLYCSSNSLTSLPTLPDGLQYLDCSSNSLTELPTLPDGLLGLVCHNNSLTTAVMDDIVEQLDANGVENGQLYLTSQTTTDSPTDTAPAFLSLIAKGWYIQYGNA